MATTFPDTQGAASDLGRTEKSTLAVSFALLAFPLIQIGFTYYLSTGLVLILLLMWTVLAQLSRSTVGVQSFFLIIPFLFLNLIWGTGRFDIADFLRNLREGVFFAISLVALRLAVTQPVTLNAKRIVQVMLALVVGMLILTVVQMVFIRRGIYLGLPEEWYISNAAALPGELDLKYSKIRPAGSFGEPSYLGFFLFSLIIMLVPMLERSSRCRWTVGLAIVCGLLSQSVSFILAMAILSAVWVGRSNLAVTQKIVLGAMLVVGTFGVFVLIDGLLERFASIGSGEDSSAQYRIVMPFLMIPSFLTEFPFGKAFSELPAILSPMASRLGWGYEAPMDNAMANLVFIYGLIGIALIAIIASVARDAVLRSYILLAMFFNGGIFTIDKCSMILLVCVVYRSMVGTAGRLRLREAQARDRQRALRRIQADAGASAGVGTGTGPGLPGAPA